MGIQTVVLTDLRVWIYTLLPIILIAVALLHTPWIYVRACYRFDNSSGIAVVSLYMFTKSSITYVNETIGSANYTAIEPLVKTEYFGEEQLYSGRFWYVLVLVIIMPVAIMLSSENRRVRVFITIISSIILFLYVFIGLLDTYSIWNSVTRKYSTVSLIDSRILPIGSILLLLSLILVIALNRRISRIIEETLYLIKEYEFIHGHGLMEEYKKCPRCGARAPVNARFCPYCGYAFPASHLRYKICHGCGAKVPVEVRYCPYCGFDFEKAGEG